MSDIVNPKMSGKEVRALLNYDPDNGIFHWRITRQSRLARAGMVAGHITKNGYVAITINGRTLMAHRITWLWITDKWPDLDIDHINGVRDDNRFASLRTATRTTNNQNRHTATKGNRSSGLLGVTWNRGRWTAQITIPNKGRTYLGRFNDPNDAYAAYLNAKRIYHPGCTI